jgi:3-dehydroquinate dehydratase-1
MARAITPVVVRNVTIGAGIPKIIAPITGDDAEQLQAQVAALEDHHVDVVEWRVDRLHSVSDKAAVLSIAHTLRQQLGDRPLLFTCRTRAEGGAAAIDDVAYGELNVALVESGTVDLVDVEYQRTSEVVLQILTAARERRVAVVASNHDFARTPERHEIVARLRAMQNLGADICKIAVMPRSPADVLTLLDATRIMREEFADRPLITMSMGKLGVVSRLAGQLFGSAATFGMFGAASAPGQIDGDDLYWVLRLLNRAG